MYNTDIPAVGNQHVRSRLCGYFGGGKLGIHASGAHIASCAALTHIHIGIIQFFHDFHKFGLGVLPGIVGIKAVDIGKQDQQIRPYQRRNDGGQCIIVHFQLIGRYRIIFIDYRYHPHLQKLGEGIVGVITVKVIHDCIFGHEDLGRHLIILGKNTLVGHHEPGLSYGGTGLLHSYAVMLRDVLFLQIHRLFPLGDGS